MTAIRRFLGAGLLALLLLPGVSTATDVAEGPVVCFYGPPVLDRLSRFRTVVLLPSRTTSADVDALRSKGVRVLGYLSLGEDDRLRRGDGRGPGGYASWYLDEHRGDGLESPGSDDAPDRNADWGSYYVDPSNRDWRRHVREEAAFIREELGMDGVFADTVMIPRDVFTNRTEDRLHRGMVSLVKSLKGWTRSGFVLVNNGEEMVSGLGRRIDGLMVETNAVGEAGDWNDVRVQTARLAELARTGGWLVTALVYLGPAADPSAACAIFDPLRVPAALYRDDSSGRALTTLPLATCPAGR